MMAKQGKDVDSDIFWGVVSEKMGGKRGRQQCRNKWLVIRSLAHQMEALLALGRIL